MKIQEAFLKIIEGTNELLDDFLFKCSNRLKPEYFSRRSKMGFKETALFILNCGKKSLQLELNSFFQKILHRNESVKKQSFLEAREKIDPKALKEINQYLVDTVYDKCDNLELWDGKYRLSAIDGSVFEIPDTKLLRNEFGIAKNQNREVARARAACIYDVLNKLVITSKIGRYDKSERDTAKEMIEELVKENKAKSDLILFDRGYTKAALFAYLSDNNIDFVMRCARNYSNIIKTAKKEDQIIEINFKQKTYKLRVLRFLLSSGEEEILITTLLDNKYTVEDFKKLYFLRWEVEVNYNILKNRLEIENFTSNSKIAVEQDFYATIYLANMAQLARKQTDEIIQTNNKDKDNQYEYKTNTNILIGSLKEEFILLLLETNNRKRRKKYKQLLNTIAKSTVPIRPNRHVDRIYRRPRGKFKTNQKKCL